ncbi:GNAT family N-acetyltransferase [Bradyrhizobium sp. HKCCYLS1011]|uniref:GNAT family N-acetyltransferase n=1 Tax=Bradyrhizobium sp. HKCCYLS1011 TaxID=3420733 RepID=UPI003EBA2EFE
MRIEEITTAAALEWLRPDWIGLWQRAVTAGPFQHPDWLLSWWRWLGGGQLFVLAVRDGAELAALAPFYITTEAASGERQLTLLGNGVSDCCDVLLDPGRSGAKAALAEALKTRSAGWTSYDLRDLPPDSALLSIFGDEPEASISRDTPTVVVDLRGGAEGSLLSPRMTADLRRCRRRAEEIGVLSMDFASSEELIARAMDVLFALHHARWRARDEAGVLHGSEREAFYREVAARFARHGWLRLLTLSLGDRVVGASFDFQVRGRAYHYIGGFAPELGMLGIGSLMLQQLIARAIRDGAGEFDFLRGEEDYKRRWGGVPRPHYRIRPKQVAETARKTEDKHAGAA